MFRAKLYSISRSVIATAVLLAATTAATAQAPPPWGSKMWPWNVGGYQGYEQPSRPPTPPPPLPHTAPSPQRYTLQISVLPQKNEADPNAALLVAHLPEDARIWFEDGPTKQTGTLRQFYSPPLKPGKNYTYTVRVQWPEDGQWVNQLHSFPVHAGDIHCIDIIPSESKAVEKEVADNLAKLDPEARKAAEEQRFCAVQEGIRLGSMGVPVKVTLKGQTVYLCCEGCEGKAKANPDQTLEKVRKIRPKNTGASSP
jgi:uncharacterized protein (TIGR03000 family)